MAVILGLGLLLAGILIVLLLRQSSGSQRVQERGKEEIGARFTLAEPIIAGQGKAVVRGREWLIDGPDLDAGTPVEVIAERNGRLFVAPDLEKASLPKAGRFG